MKNLVCYKELPEWDFKHIPKLFQEKHNTKIGTWAKLTILEGEIIYYELDELGNIIKSSTHSKENQKPFISPQEWHKIKPIGNNVRCKLSFYCEKKDYYQKKYHLGKTHSEVLDLMQYIKSGDALDLGCGRGRNSLFLQQNGFNVTSTDINSDAINNLNNIINKEKLVNIYPHVKDANLANINKDYDLIISLVVLMFLSKQKQPEIIANIQKHTKVGGYNLIVCALESPDYPCPPTLFSAAMQIGELKNYYKKWDIKKYNENIGNLHKLDIKGNPITLRFATIIAKKI